MQPPQRKADDAGVWLEPLQVWALWWHEVTAPEGGEPFDWLLLRMVAFSRYDRSVPDYSFYGRYW